MTKELTKPPQESMTKEWERELFSQILNSLEQKKHVLMCILTMKEM